MTKIIPLLLILFASQFAIASDDCPIVPLPSTYYKSEGQVPLASIKEIHVLHRELDPVAHYLQREILRHTGMAVSLVPAPGVGKGITLTLNKTTTGTDEGYTLNIHPGKIEISASTSHGVFNGVASLLQLIRMAASDEEGGSIACWQIEDAPEMKWRGVMLDESRHFFGMEAVKMMLDWMALYKLNRFHWHLTDAPGWRIEIRSYPKLSLVGGIGNHTDPLAPAAYYTQEEIKEIVRYASDRFIEVIPEIDMPGHATAANRAYPEYSGGGTEKYPDFTFNPGKEGTYQYLTDILREVDVLFPSKMIHLGGDEVHFGNEKWNTDEHVQRLMKEKKLKDLKAVERYFVERMADSIMQFNARVLGWDEIASTSIAPENTIIFWWRHDKPETLKQSIDNGYQVVLCPRIPLYLDFVQESSHISGRKWQGTFSDLRTIYHYSPAQYSNILKKKDRNLIAGIQGNVWSERIASKARLEFMLFPRITALAEAAWTRAENRDYDKFMTGRLSKHEALFEEANLHYYDAGSPGRMPEIVDPQIED